MGLPDIGTPNDLHPLVESELIRLETEVHVKIWFALLAAAVAEALLFQFRAELGWTFVVAVLVATLQAVFDGTEK